MSGLNTERVVTRAEAAAYLREFADKLASDGHTDATNTGTTTDTGVTGANTTEGRSSETTSNADSETGRRSDTDDATSRGATDQRDEHHSPAGKVTFLVGNDSATVNPPEEVTLDVSVGEDSSMMSSGAETVTFSLRWDKEAVPESDELRIE